VDEYTDSGVYVNELERLGWSICRSLYDMELFL